MKIADRLTIIETKLKYIEKTLYIIGGLILAQLGITNIPTVMALG